MAVGEIGNRAVPGRLGLVVEDRRGKRRRSIVTSSCELCAMPLKGPGQQEPEPEAGAAPVMNNHPQADRWMRANPKAAAQGAVRWIPGLKPDVAEAAIQYNIQQVDRRLSANNYRALWAAQDRLHRLGLIKSTFDVNKHFEPGPILTVTKDRPDLFSDLPPIPANAMITSGWVFRP